MWVAAALWASGSFLGKSTPFHPRPAPFIALFAIGFALATIGHVVHSKTAVVTGIAMVFCATILVPIALYLSSR